MPEPTAPYPDPAFGDRRVASGRIGRLLIAHFCASIVAAVVRTLGLVIEESWLRGFDRLIADNGWSALAIVPAITALIVFVASAPFVTAFLVWSEGRGVRSLAVHLVAGVAVGLATQALLTLPFAGASAAPGLFGLAALAGLVAARVFWQIAVRSAPPPPRPFS